MLQRRVLLFWLLLCLTFPRLDGCDRRVNAQQVESQEFEPISIVRVRFVHALASSRTRINVNVDGQDVVTSLSQFHCSEYVNVIIPATANSAFVLNAVAAENASSIHAQVVELGVSAKTNYTSFTAIIREAGVLITIDPSAAIPEQGVVKLRLVHASKTFSRPLRLYMGNKSVGEAIFQDSAGLYIPSRPDNKTAPQLRVVDSTDSNKTVFSSPPRKLLTETSYSLIFLDSQVAVLTIDQTNQAAFVRVAHAAPGIGSIDLTNQDTKRIASSISYGTISPYGRLHDGIHQLNVTTVVGVGVGSHKMDILGGRYYTVMLDGESSVRIVQDQIVQPVNAKNVAVRFINLLQQSGSGASVTINLGKPSPRDTGSSLVVPSQEASDYIMFPTGIREFTVASGKQTITSIPRAKLNSGNMAYSVFLLGPEKGKPNQAGGPEAILMFDVNFNPENAPLTDEQIARPGDNEDTLMLNEDESSSVEVESSATEAARSGSATIEAAVMVALYMLYIV